MTKFLIFFSSLLLAFVVSNMVYLFTLPRVDWDFSKTKEAHNFKDEKLQVLVFGNSTAMDGINAEILSSNLGPAYNFSIGGASLQTSYIQLLKYLKNNSKPAKILLFLSSAHTTYNTTNAINPIVEYYYTNYSNISGLKDIPLFKFRWLFIENIKKLLSSGHRSAEVIKGQLSIKSFVPDNSAFKKKSDSCQGSSFYNNIGYEYMWQMAKLCYAKGIEMEVFEMPCWKDIENDCSDIIVSKNNYSLNIINLNNHLYCDSLLDPQKDWLSRDHLNYFGAIKITNAVIGKLSK